MSDSANAIGVRPATEGVDGRLRMTIELKVERARDADAAEDAARREAWRARCAEVDATGTGSTAREALGNLADAIDRRVRAEIALLEGSGQIEDPAWERAFQNVADDGMHRANATIVALRDRLRRRCPEVEVGWDPPPCASDAWGIEVRLASLYLVVTWSPRDPERFGVSQLRSSSGTAGGTDEWIVGADAACDRLVEFLTTTERPAPPLPVLLRRLREERSLTREQVARQMRSRPDRVARCEQRSDLELSLLRRFVAALGGMLMVWAIFPDGEHRLVTGEVGEGEEIGTFAAPARPLPAFLRQLREARGVMQEQLAERMRSGLEIVVACEQRSDLALSLLRRFVVALGGELRVRAIFTDAMYEVTEESATQDDIERGSSR